MNILNNNILQIITTENDDKMMIDNDHNYERDIDQNK